MPVTTFIGTPSRNDRDLHDLDNVEGEPSGATIKAADGGMTRTYHENANLLMQTIKGDEEVSNEVFTVMEAHHAMASNKGNGVASMTMTDASQTMGMGLDGGYDEAASRAKEGDIGGTAEIAMAGLAPPSSIMFQVEDMIQKRFGELRSEFAAAFERLCNIERFEQVWDQRFGQGWLPGHGDIHAMQNNANYKTKLRERPDSLRDALDALIEDSGQIHEPGSAQALSTQHIHEALRMITHSVDGLLESSAKQHKELQEIVASFRSNINDPRVRRQDLNTSNRSFQWPDIDAGMKDVQKQQNNIACIRAGLQKVRQNLNSHTWPPAIVPEVTPDMSAMEKRGSSSAQVPHPVNFEKPLMTGSKSNASELFEVCGGGSPKGNGTTADPSALPLNSELAAGVMAMDNPQVVAAPKAPIMKRWPSMKISIPRLNLRGRPTKGDTPQQCHSVHSIVPKQTNTKTLTRQSYGTPRQTCVTPRHTPRQTFDSLCVSGLWLGWYFR